MTRRNLSYTDFPPSPAGSIAAFRSVYKTFPAHAGSIPALVGFDLDVFENETLVLMGPSGCGKSTAINLLAGHERPTSGIVTFEGGEVRGTSVQRGVVFQQESLFPWRTVEGNVVYAHEAALRQRFHGVRRLRDEAGSLMPWKWRAQPPLALIDHKALQYLEVVGMSEFRSHLPKELSGGMRKRVELARAYAANPRLLMMDEPFGNLDALTREDMQFVLEDLRNRTRCTVIFVTHDWHEAVAVADRIAVMTRRPGRVHSLLEVNLPRPRTAEVRRSREFAEVAEYVRDRVRQLADTRWEERERDGS